MKQKRTALFSFSTCLPVSTAKLKCRFFSGLRRLRPGQRGRRAGGVSRHSAQDAQVEPGNQTERPRRRPRGRRRRDHQRVSELRTFAQETPFTPKFSLFAAKSNPQTQIRQERYQTDTNTSQDSHQTFQPTPHEN